MKVELFPRVTLAGRKWYFRVRAENGEIVASSEGYSRRIDAEETARHVTGDRFPIYTPTGENGE